MDAPTDTLGFAASPLKQDKKGKGKLLLIAGLVILLIGGTVLGIRNFQKEEPVKDMVVSETPTPTEEVTPEPTEEEEATTPTPTKKVTPTPRDAADVTAANQMKVQVLNGSGEEGVASKARDHLKGKGYTDLETGNADNFDYQQVTVKIKSSLKKFLSALEGDLKDAYTISTGSGTLLPDDSLFDAVVIVGK